MLVVVTNWNTVGSMQLQSPPRTYQVQQGQRHTNTFLVYQVPGEDTNRWTYLTSVPGDKLKEHRLVETLPIALHPPPLPINPPPPSAVSNVGTVNLEQK